MSEISEPTAELRVVQINVNFDETNGAWNQPARNVFLEAVSIWEQILVSDVPIEINARFEPLGAGILGAAGAAGISTNFPSTDDLFRNDLFYVNPLANKLAGVDLSPAQVDINAIFNSNFLDFYFGTDGQPGVGQWDFMTVALHEIAHGLGFASSVRSQAGSNLLFYGFGDGMGNVFPMVYDDFLADAGGGFLRDLPIGVFSPQVTNFATNPVFWNTASIGGGGFANGETIFAPNFFQPGSSISHLDEATYPGELMTPVLNPGEAIHTPSVISNAMLENIGWDSDFTTGVEDDLYIQGFSQYCWETAQDPCSPFDASLNTELTIGEEYYYAWNFNDSGPYTTFNSGEWKFEILHSEGSYLVAENAENLTDHPYAFGFELPNLPESYTWSRNAKNQIRAILTLSGTDSDGVFHQEKKLLTINYIPDEPTVQLSGNGEGNCSSVNLTFQSRGADSFIIRFKSQDDPFWTTFNVPEGKLEYTLQGLDESKHYYFQLDAINEFGAMSSIVYGRRACVSSGGVIIDPNPGKDEVRVSSKNENIIKSIQIFKNDDPGVNLYRAGDGYSSQLQINVSNLPSGLYRVILTEKDGNVVKSALTIVQ